ncbi:hypothetical protein [Ligilactobacillus animalis]|uniref:hypothetical protein n=1 Tax=Ligilactobacillus animalis TaxID=1605 RepID=UPI0010A2FB84|nr:hypothetical protein [Ligilactobacillus animalis]MDO5882523.1 hypothetical protein [Ligilactobacillus animalis]MDU1488261.1 hypothetical protein [Ligilactobacillus animalis]THE20239.1 hypothetical protein ACH45_07900 [Ligilactobacillus animalis]THE21439.1 hypothetical protein ACH44_04470 [Ligilactobacillus animalis]
MTDQVWVAVISTLGSIIVAYITASANSRKADKKDDISELEKLREENAKLKEKIKSRVKRNGNK